MNNSFLNFTVYSIPDVKDSDFSFFGHNRKEILLAYIHSNEESFVYLNRILSSLKINAEEDCLIFKIKNEFSYLPHLHEVLSENTFSKAVFFGIKPCQLGLHIDLPQQQQFIKIQNTKILFTDDLAEIQKSSITHRSLLRDNLKLLFDLL